jgi:hypothetical protein
MDGGGGEVGGGFGAPLLITVHAGSGLGYARSSEDELKFILDVGSRTGIILDPVYSGKALYHFLREVLPRRKDLFLKGQKVLFIHTGGTAGVYDKADQLGPILRDNPPKPMLVKAPPRAQGRGPGEGKGGGEGAASTRFL